MKKIFKSILDSLLQWHIRKQKKTLTVLAYHSIHDIENFENQLIYLKKNFNIISCHDLIRNLYGGKMLPVKALLITFDDGDRSLFLNAYSILKKHQIPAIIFVITDLINSEKPFWWDELEYYLGKERGNQMVWEVKKWRNKKRIGYLQRLRNNPKKTPLKYQQLNEKELSGMNEAGILIGNHSHTHPMLDKCTSEEMNFEIQESITKLNSLGFAPYIFAYPNGNYSLMSEKKLKTHGIKISFLFNHKINYEKLNPLRISRLAVNDTTELLKLKFILSGFHSKLLPFIRFVDKSSKKFK